MPVKPPVARVEPVCHCLHGRLRTDEYAWLEDENWQDVMCDQSLLRTDIREYLEAENAFTEAMMAETQPLQDALFAEMRGRIKEDVSSVAARDGAFEYYVRFREGGAAAAGVPHGLRRSEQRGDPCRR